ncbi:MAG: hypothetical protein K2M44_00860, partial [Clostridia bacterium]|nr:hypothetical protein [Clostridia bacterium]
AVRPAFHLNLTAADAAALFGLKEPADVTTEYTGEALSLDDISADSLKWYDSDKIDIEYPDSDILDAGEYELIAKINKAYADEGVKFQGTPAAGETDTTRKFKYTVTKKKIGVTAEIGSSGMPTYSLNNDGDIYIGDTEDNGRAPQLKFEYADSSGKVIDGTPTAVGSYTATVIIGNECNYEIDTSSGYKISFSIEKRQIVKPSISGLSSVEYNGEEQSFSLSGVSEDIKIVCGAGITYDSGKLKAKQAGKYTVSISLSDGGESTKWADGSTATYTLQVEIRKRALGIVIQSASGWEWGVDDTPKIQIIGDSLVGDRTELYIYYMKSGDSTKYDDINNNKTFSEDFKTRTIVMPKLAQGSYTIVVELVDESARDNINYTMAAPKTAMFKVLGNEVSFDASKDLKWQYNSKQVADWSSVQEYEYEADGYKFDIDDTSLADKGVKIDVTKGTNGYSGDITASDARSGAYSVTVYITALSTDYKEFNGQYTLTYKINKAKYDLSGLSWNYNDSTPLQFIAGKTQGITLTGSLPSGLSIEKYTGNDKIPVGSYVTSVSFTVADSTNYFRPISSDSGTYTGSFEWSKAWRIVKAELDVSSSWKTDNRDGVTTYNLPILQSVNGIDVDAMVVYRYYVANGEEKGNEVTIEDINADANTEKSYIVEAELKSEYADKYELKGASTSFTVGKDRYPVKLKIDIDGQQLPYTPKGRTPKISIESAGGLTIGDIEITYYKDGSDVGSTSIPTAVGSYRAVVTLKYGGEDNYIEPENSEFTFEIIKADLDVSGLKWEYTHEDVSATYDAVQGKWLNSSGAEVSAFKYDGKEHKIELIGLDTLPDGLSVTTSGNLRVTGASGSYTASVKFVYDTACYNAPDFATSLSWAVNKAKIDTSAIVWGYTDKEGNEYSYIEAFKYTRVSGAAVEYSVRLINLPDALKDCIKISGESTKSEAGTFRARYTVDADAFDSDNYEPYVMPSGLKEYFDWAISARVIDAPVYDNSWSKFDGSVHDFSAMFGLPDDWKEYVSITITLDGKAYAGLGGDDFASTEGKEYKGYDAGVYEVTFALINGGNNLMFSSRVQKMSVSVAKDKYTVDKWIDNDEYSQVAGTLPVYYDYR